MKEVITTRNNELWLAQERPTVGSGVISVGGAHAPGR